MGKTHSKIQSEFDEKIRESISQKDAAGSTASPTEESEVIPVVEEQVHIGKRVVETGKVHITKRVHQEDVTVDAPAAHEEIDVERVPINKYVDSTPDVRYEGDTTIIPVMREEAVVVKKLVLVEELRVTKRIVKTSQPTQVTLRKEEVDIDREDTGEDIPH